MYLKIEMNNDVFHVVWNIEKDLSSARLNSHMWSFAAPDMSKVVYPIKPWALKCYPELVVGNDFDKSTLYFSSRATLGDVMETIRKLYKPYVQCIWFLGFDAAYFEDGHLPIFRCFMQVI